MRRRTRNRVIKWGLAGILGYIVAVIMIVGMVAYMVGSQIIELISGIVS